MVIFHSYVKLPEAKFPYEKLPVVPIEHQVASFSVRPH